jgi:TrpR-related protein YerC/YecD
MNKGKPFPHKQVKAKAEKELAEALLLLRTADEAKRFLYDICTPKEIADLSDRWLVARMLDEGKHSYREIHALTGVSITTVGRVARFLQHENFGGYRALISRMKNGK